MTTQAEMDAINTALSEARKLGERLRADVALLKHQFAVAEQHLAEADSHLTDLLDRQFDARRDVKK